MKLRNTQHNKCRNKRPKKKKKEERSSPTNAIFFNLTITTNYRE